MKTLFSQGLVDTLQKDIKRAAQTLENKGIEPHLGVILVGTNQNSLKFIEIKTRMAKEIGIILSLYHLEEDSDFVKVKETIEFLNADPEIHGLILQLPLPGKLFARTDELIALLSPKKDVDGLRGDWQQLSLSATTLSALLIPQPFALPPMVTSVCSLLDYYHIPLEGKRLVLVGKGRLVGDPLLQFFHKVGLNAQAVESSTEHILEITKEADILIAGTGQENLISNQWIKEGAVVIDCAADVQVASVSQVAAAISPSIGGVGPLTVSWLLHNLVQAAANLENYA